MLQPNQIEDTKISTETVVLSAVNIPSSVVFVLFQAHSHVIPLTLSMDNELVESRYTNGSSIGVIVELDIGSSHAQCYVSCPLCADNTTIVVMASYLTREGKTMRVS